MRCSVKSATTLCPRRGHRVHLKHRGWWVLIWPLRQTGGLSPQPSNRETQFAEVAEGLREPPRQQAAEGVGVPARTQRPVKAFVAMWWGLVILGFSLQPYFFLCLYKCKKRAEWKVPRLWKRLLLLQRVYCVIESFTTNKFFSPPTWEKPCCLVCCAGAKQKWALQGKASDCGSIQQNPWHCDPHLPVIVEDSILRVSCVVVYFHCALTTALYSTATEKALPVSQWHSSSPLGSVLLWTHLNLDCFTYSCFQRIRIGPLILTEILVFPDVL